MEVITIYAHTEYFIENFDASVACIGFFDGVHKGHQRLLSITQQEAKQRGITSACITFDVDPWVILKPEANIEHLTPVNSRLEQIAAYGIEVCYLLHFNQDMAELQRDKFIRLLKTMNVVCMVCGDDFRFGHKNGGDVNYLKNNIPTIISPMVTLHNEKISSSAIEAHLKKGDVTFAKDALARLYEMRGTVIDGRKVGRTLGFPTANIEVDTAYVWPKQGVYAGYIQVEDRSYLALINIGYNLTINTRSHLSLEVHILNFNREIYGEYVYIFFYEKLRDEIKFSTIDDLIQQMHKDKERLEELKDEIITFW